MQNQNEAGYNIRIPVFEGPFDLLLHLIKENKLDIYDIPIAKITHEYLEYLEVMKELNLDVASEFLVMAATLIYIKSRMLLPPDETIEAAEDEDPRAGLVQRLLEYQAFRDASSILKGREEIWTNAFERPPIEIQDQPQPEPELYLFDVNIFDLMGALKKILSKVPPETMNISRETLTVADKISILIEKIEQEKTLRFEDLFAGDREKLQVIVTFLALLEVLRLRIAKVYQDREFGHIWIIGQDEQDEIDTTENQTPSDVKLF